MAFKLSFGIYGDATSGKKALEETAAAAGKAKGALQGVAPVAEKTSQATVALGRASHGAAGSVGNLTAQFNDIGVMLMAGQNPLQLAIQQGTQITQVIGPMGAAGAVRALGSALLGMLNPVSLITIGSIAAGAAMIQWLTASSDEADAAAEQMDALREKVGALDKALKAVESYNFDSKLDGMAAAADQIKVRFQDILAVVERVQAASQAAALAAIKEQSGLADAMRQFNYDADIAGRTGSEQPSFDYMGLDSLYEARFVLTAINEIEGSTREELLASVDATTEKLWLTGMLTSEVQAYLATVAQELGLNEQISASVNEQVAQQQLATASVDELLASLSAAAGVNLAQVFANAQGSANALLATTGSILAQLAAAGKANAYIQSNQRGGAGYLANQYALYGAGRTASEQKSSEMGPLFAPVAVAPVVTGGAVRSGRAGRAGGARASGGGGAAKQRDATADLIAREQDELALLKETDPVQKEMLRNRKALADATDAERATVQGLITERIREQETMKSLQAQREFYTDTAYGELEQMVFEGGKLSEVFDNATEAFGRMALKAIWLGEGPLAGLFNGGSTGGGGLLGSLFSAILPAAGGGLPAKAEGGYLTGPGGGTSDDILMWGSSGEFMVNARATAKHRALLETINAGGLPGFAKGGAIGASSQGRGGAASGAQSLLRVELSPDLRASLLQEAQGQAFDICKAGISQYDSKVLPQRVGQINQNPRRVGA